MYQMFISRPNEQQIGINIQSVTQYEIHLETSTAENTAVPVSVSDIEPITFIQHIAMVIDKFVA